MAFDPSSEGRGGVGRVPLYHVMMSPDLVASKTKHCWNGRKELTHLWTRASLIDAPLVLAPAPFAELDPVLLFAAKGELPSTEVGVRKGRVPHLAVKP